MASEGSSRGGRVLVVALVVDSVGNGLFLPLSLVYFTALTGISLSLLGVLLSTSTAVTLPVPLWAGSLADRIGALPVVVGAQLLQAAGLLAYTGVRGPVGILAATTVVAVGVRFFWSAIFTALADHADASRDGRGRDSWYAVANAARTAGLAVGGLVTAAVVADGGVGAYRAVAGVATACYLAAAALIAAFVRAPAAHRSEGPTGAGYRELARDRVFLGLIVLNTVWALSSMMLAIALPTVVLRALHGPSWLTAVLLVTNAVLITAASAPVVRRVAGYRRTRVLVVAAGLWALWCAAMAALALLDEGGRGHLSWVVAALGGATLLFTTAEVLHGPVSTALAAAAAPPQARGRYLAAFQYSFALASIIAPAFFADLFTVDHAAPWVALGVLDLASILGLRSLERRLPPAAVHGRPPSLTAQAPVPAAAPEP